MGYTPLNYNFQFVCELKIERDEEGKINCYYPQQRFDNIKNLKLHAYGDGPFCKFNILRGWSGKTGVYIFIIDEKPMYVGECEDLESRFNTGYGNISPRNCFEGGQPTNCRLNNAILNAINEGHTINLLFYETQDRFIVEANLIAALKPEWNRSSGKRMGTSRKDEDVGERAMRARTNNVETGCREEVLRAAREIVNRKGKNEFSIKEILYYLHSNGTLFQDTTIRTHITSRCCGDAPKHHGSTYDDFRRLGQGRYRLKKE